MSYIVPNSTIYLLEGVPFKNDYLDTAYWYSQSAQQSYFMGLTAFTFDKYSYQRSNRGYIRVQALADDLFDCNYMMFRNESHTLKWFYCFITSVDYINENTTQISYEIDIIQTYFFDVQFGQCLIERQHQAIDDDMIGANIEAEPFTLNEEYVYNESPKIILDDVYSGTSNLGVIVDAVKNPEDSQFYANVYEGVMCGSEKRLFTLSGGADSLLNYLNEYFSTDPEAVLNIYCVPVSIVDVLETNVTYVEESSEGYSTSEMVDYIYTGNATLDGYSPYNNKCFTYPYCFYSISNGTSVLALKYEFGDIEQVNEGSTGADASDSRSHLYVSVYGSYNYPPSITIRPKNYKGSGEDYDDVNMQLTLDSFPVCSWSNDTYAAWLANNSATYGYEIGKVLVSSLIPSVGYTANSSSGTSSSSNYTHTMNIDGNTKQTFNSRWTDSSTDESSNNSTGLSANGSLTGVAKSMLLSAIDLSENSKKAELAADTLSGNTATSALMSNSALVFTGARMSQPYSVMERIDMYFQMYGYAQNKVDVPSRCVRDHWTFVKTRGCIVYGNCNSQVLSNIASIHDRGIRYWVNANNVGDFGKDN